jgi:uncharacterized secreted protein with C-terminal beta-propeller domain
MRVYLAAVLVAGLAACNNNNDNTDLEVGPRNRTSPALRNVNSCNELESTLRAHIKEEMRVRLLQTLEEQPYLRLETGAANGAEVDAASSDDMGRQEGTDFSGTNNQEAGVDEADFVKTDGHFIYVLNGDRLEILAVPTFGELTEASTTTIEGYPSQMLIGDDRAVVFSVVNAYNLEEGHPLRAILNKKDGQGPADCWYPMADIIKLTVLDIGDKAAPTVEHELYMEGSYQTARRVDSSVRMASYSQMDIPGLVYWPELPEDYYTFDPFNLRSKEILKDAVEAAISRNNATIDSTPLADLVPQLFERRDDEIVAHPFTDAACSSFAIADDSTSRGFTSIISFDLLGDHVAFDADHVLSSWPVVYASTNTLLLAEPANDWWWYWDNDDYLEATNIHRFDTSVAGQSRYTGSGRIDGTVQGQFSLSEREGYVRVATTTGQWNRWWMEDPAPSESHVIVLAGESSLEEVGRVGGIGMGERLWSARFVGDKAFLVTFRNIDPLWTIDLADPTQPKVVGELEVPGVSTYIHPLEGDALLTIGFGGTDTGLDWSNQVSLFDVSDFAAPALDGTLRLNPPNGDDWIWGWSEATYQHKAFQYWAPKSMLAVPVGTHRYDVSGYEYYSRLELISVDAAAGALTRHGAVDHASFYNDQTDDYWYNPEIRRSIFMGDYIYAISDRAVTAHTLDTLTLSASVPLPGARQTYYGYAHAE